MLTESISLFDISAKSSLATEKRPLIDSEAFKDSYKNMEIDGIANVKCENNISDPLVHIRTDSILLRVKRTSNLDQPSTQ